MTRNSIMNLLIAVISALFIRALAEPDDGLIRAAVGGRDGLHHGCIQGVVDRDYSLTARIRLLVVWISRPGVGAGRITWSRCDNGASELGLLIGSDPAKAPMKINRWGYIAERISGSGAELLGIMTEAEEQSIEQARTNLTGSQALHNFKAISAKTQDGTAQSRISYMKLPEDYTLYEVDALLRRVPREGARVRTVSLPTGAEPGFLFAVRSLVRESVEAYRNSGISNVARNALRRYSFSGTLYELRRKSTREVRELDINGRKFRQLLESTFQTRNLANGQLSHFSITYGIQDPIDGVPVRIVYRPRWWFEAEMLLDGDATAAPNARGEASWKPGAN